MRRSLLYYRADGRTLLSAFDPQSTKGPAKSSPFIEHLVKVIIVRCQESEPWAVMLRDKGDVEKEQKGN